VHAHAHEVIVELFGKLVDRARELAPGELAVAVGIEFREELVGAAGGIRLDPVESRLQPGAVDLAPAQLVQLGNSLSAACCGGAASGVLNALTA